MIQWADDLGALIGGVGLASALQPSQQVPNHRSIVSRPSVSRLLSQFQNLSHTKWLGMLAELAVQGSCHGLSVGNRVICWEQQTFGCGLSVDIEH